MTTDYQTWKAEWDAKMARAIASINPATTRWSVRGYRAHETMDGVAFVFRLGMDGKAVAFVEDAGRGGGPRVVFADGWKSQAAAEWRAFVEQMFPNDGMAEELAVEALLQAYGV